MKSFAVLSATLVLVQVAVAQNIPTGISSTCTSFLQAFDSNADIKAAVGPINEALSAFSADKYSSATQQQLESALSATCGASFSESAFKQQLQDFATDCADDLTGPNANRDVQEVYDRVYSLPALRRAICAKDDKGGWCAANLPSGSSSDINMGNSADPDAAVSTMFDGTDLAFLFVDSDASKDTLCVPCTRSIILAYTSWEAANPYALGLSKSRILGGQPDLWNGIKTTCGNSFLTTQSGNSGPINVGGSLGMGSAANTASHHAPSAAFGTLALAVAAFFL
jgi:hypothetical protein